MIDEVAKIGDEVVINISQKDLEQGYSPSCADGTKATIIGFAETYFGRLSQCVEKPGVYVNRAWAKVKTERGLEYQERTDRLELVDADEYQLRIVEFRNQQKEDLRRLKERDFIRELPETLLYEGDLVRVPGLSAPKIIGRRPFSISLSDVFKIVGINYHDLNRGKGYPVYNVSDNIGGWSVCVSEEQIDTGG